MLVSAPQVSDVAGTDSRLHTYAVDFGIADDDATQVAVEFFWPHADCSPVLFFCLPGGGMNREFFDLQGAGDRFSFARQMAARGFICALVDPPGVGASDAPEDGFALTPQRLANILAQVHSQVCDDLQAGRIDESLPAIGKVVSIGLGHSMGALLTVLQQHASSGHAALALLGFSTQGLPQYLPSEAKVLLDEPEQLRAQMVTLARQMFGESYPQVKSGGGGDFYRSAQANRQAVKAIKPARDVLLPVPAFMSMLPGNVAPEAAAINVPVYLGLGEDDFVGLPETEDAGFVNSSNVEQKILPATGHSFFLFDSREQLFDGLAHWARDLSTHCY